MIFVHFSFSHLGVSICFKWVPAALVNYHKVYCCMFPCGLWLMVTVLCFGKQINQTTIHITRIRTKLCLKVICCVMLVNIQVGVVRSLAGRTNVDNELSVLTAKPTKFMRYLPEWVTKLKTFDFCVHWHWHVNIPMC